MRKLKRWDSNSTSEATGITKEEDVVTATATVMDVGGAVVDTVGGISGTGTGGSRTTGPSPIDTSNSTT